MTKYISYDDRLLSDDDIFDDSIESLNEQIDSHFDNESLDDLDENDDELISDNNSLFGDISKRNNGHYVTNNEIEIEYNKSLLINEPTPKLIEYFTLIAQNSVVLLKMKSKLDVECCVTYGISRAWEKWDKYDPNNSQNYFAFFTQMILNDMKTHRTIHLGYKDNNKKIYFNDIFMD